MTKEKTEKEQEDNLDQEKPKIDKKDNFFRNTIIASFTAILIVCLPYSFKFGEWFNFGRQQEFANFGNYIGGTLNPILSFITIIILLINLKITQKALHASNRATRQQADHFNEEAEKKNISGVLDYYFKFLTETDTPLFFVTKSHRNPWRTRFNNVIIVPLNSDNLICPRIDERAKDFFIRSNIRDEFKLGVCCNEIDRTREVMAQATRILLGYVGIIKLYAQYDNGKTFTRHNVMFADSCRVLLHEYNYISDDINRTILKTFELVGYHPITPPKSEQV